MHKKIIFILLTFILSFNLFAYTITKQVGKVSLRVGASSRDIMPFLEKVAVNWGKYFDYVYADYRNEKIFINIKANGLYLTFEEIEKAGYTIANETALTYPLCDANIFIFAHPLDRSWQKMEWVLKEGKITDYLKD
jgi:hypothetical protein